MLKFWISVAAVMVAFGALFAAEVEVKPTGTATPPASKPHASPSAKPAATSSATPSNLPMYRPAMLGLGPNSVVNRMDTAGLIRDGQKDGSLYFRCSVGKNGEILETWTY